MLVDYGWKRQERKRSEFGTERDTTNNICYIESDIRSDKIVIDNHDKDGCVSNIFLMDSYFG